MLELNRDKGYSVSKLCDLAGISKSGYYKWLGRKPSRKEVDDMFLSDEIKRIHVGANKVFGVERVQLALKVELGLNTNIKRVRRLMRIMGLSSVVRRKRPNHIPSVPQQTAENLMGRDFEADRPNQKWFTDVTYLKYGNGSKAYLSAIIDRCDMSVVAWKISTSNDNQLVMDTMKEALALNPGAKPMVQVDRGYQYTSGMFWDMKREYGFEISMSRVSKCLDNQPIESFWGTYKSEFYYRTKFLTLESLIMGTHEYMDFYMDRRYVRKLGGMAPSQFRSTALAA